MDCEYVLVFKVTATFQLIANTICIKETAATAANDTTAVVPVLFTRTQWVCAVLFCNRFPVVLVLGRMLSRVILAPPRDATTAHIYICTYQGASTCFREKHWFRKQVPGSVVYSINFMSYFSRTAVGII